jgi:Fe-S cluster assembly iron-binding protein IscA
MPGGILQFPYIPILADPASLLAMIVPCHYWEPGFRQEWQEAAEATIKEWTSQFENGMLECAKNPVELSVAAASALMRVFKQKGHQIDRVWLRVGLTPEGPKMGEKILRIDESKPSEQDLVYKSHGIQIAINQQQASFLNGTLIDFREHETGSGFTFGSQ